MKNEEQFAILTKKIIELADKLPPPPKLSEDVVEPPYDTCVCGKKVLLSSEVLEALDTGVFKTLNDVCTGCKNGKKIDSENARLVCSKCKRVLCRMEPHKDPTSGFVFKAGKTYHLESCALCNPSPDGKSAPYKIIEVVLWNKLKKNNKT